MTFIKKTLPHPPAPALLANKVAGQFARTLAQVLPVIVKRLPEPPFIVQKTIAEKILRQLMAEQIELGDFDFLQDKWLQLSINDMGLSFFLSFSQDRLILSNRIKQADVSFSGNSRDFMLLAGRSEDPDTLFFQRRLVIEGDTELGLYIKNSIDGIDFDNWPKWLNKSIKKIAQLLAEQDELNTKNNNTDNNSSPGNNIH